MSRYARLNPETLTVDAVVDLTPEQYHALDGNPKQAFVRPLVTDAPPVPTATQILERAGYVVEPTQVRETWRLLDKSAEALAAEAAQAEQQTELVQLKAVLAALQAGTGAAAERIQRLERVAARLLKDQIRSHGL